MQTYLITGSDKKGRLEKFEKIVGKKISFSLNSPDFILLEMGEGSSIGIAEVRNLQKKLSLKPFQENEKVALISEAQNLTTEAQNALLKTLEEPNPTTKIFLTAPDGYWLLPTIVSRCEIIRLLVKPQIELNEKEFQEILKIFSKILTSPVGRRLKIAEEEGLVKDRASATKWLDKLTVIVRQLLLSSHQITRSKIPSELNISIFQYLDILHRINKYKKFLEANCNVKLTIDNFLIELVHLLSTPGVDSIET